MERGKGHQSIVAFKGGGSTWGAAVECAALSGFYAEKWKAAGGPVVVADKSITGSYVDRISTVVAKRATMMFEGPLAYSGFERPVGNFFGGAGGTPATVDTSAYQHVFKFADRDAKFGTFAYESVKDTVVTENPSAQFTKLKLSGKSEDVFRISMEGLGDDVKIDSSVNTTTTIDTVTVPPGGTYKVPFAQASFLLTNQTAGHHHREALLSHRETGSEGEAGGEGIEHLAEATHGTVRLLRGGGDLLDLLVELLDALDRARRIDRDG